MSLSANDEKLESTVDDNLNKLEACVKKLSEENNKLRVEVATLNVRLDEQRTLAILIIKNLAQMQPQQIAKN